jgi:hypothetical protein
MESPSRDADQLELADSQHTPGEDRHRSEMPPHKILQHVRRFSQTVYTTTSKNQPADH